MTYNVHSCVGLDGRLSPERIARVIAQFNPAVIALQELDVGRRRTGGEDQAQRLAQLLNMDHHFNATFAVEEERFGDAVSPDAPLIVCGDFNALPGSRVCRMFSRTLRHSQHTGGRRPRPTWRGRYPVLCIDHVFASAAYTVGRVEVGDTDLSRMASDHRPLIVDLSFET